MPSLKTRICLPPGAPPAQLVRQLLRLAFEEFCWFKPARYGRARLDGILDPRHIDYDAPLSIYSEYVDLTVAARTDRDFLTLFPAKDDDPPHTGGLTWVTSATEAKKASWRARHLQQVVAMMRLVQSPFAYAGIDTDVQRKRARLVPAPDGVGQLEALTVRDPSEGLAGLFWRNLFGPPFVHMFGERLSTLPEDARKDLGDGLVLVQPYELPAQAGTPEGEARERELIAHLGPECFYDFERHLKPTRRPELPSR